MYALAHEGWATSALPDPDEARGERWDGLLGWDRAAGEQGERETRFEELCRVGDWVSERLGRENGSRVGRAMKGRRERRERDERKRAEREGAKAKL